MIIYEHLLVSFRWIDKKNEPYRCYLYEYMTVTTCKKALFKFDVTGLWTQISYEYLNILFIGREMALMESHLV